MLNEKELVDQYDDTLVTLVDAHAPIYIYIYMQEKHVLPWQDTAWHIDDLWNTK